MSKSISINIELNYNLEDLRFMVGEDFPEEQFKERVYEQSEVDIIDYIRNYHIEEWCEVKELV